MNSHQVGEILAYFSAAWPKYDVYEETVNIWIDQLQRTDFETAQLAARQVVEKEDWFPSVSRFKREIREVARRRQLADWNVKALEAPVGDWQEGLAMARDSLRGVDGE